MFKNRIVIGTAFLKLHLPGRYGAARASKFSGDADGSGVPPMWWGV